MTKSDLKSGMVVKYRNGNTRIVIGDFLVGLKDHNPLSNYNHNLENHWEELCIDEVYQVREERKGVSIERMLSLKEDYMGLIWKREDKKVLELKKLLKEIVEELGHLIEL